MSVDLVPCFCLDCAGLPRNRTTIRRHFQRENVINHINDNANGLEEQADPRGEYLSDGDNGSNHDDSTLESASLDSDSHGRSDDGLDDDSDIKRFVLRHLKSKVQHGMSQEATLSGLRNIYELLGDDRIPHQNWTAVLGFLRELGYQDARVYKICFGTDHVTLMDKNECCVNCGKQWNFDWNILTSWKGGGGR